MESRARIAGHPIHPMLIAFPVALYVATVVTLLAFVATGDAFWYRVATWANLGGIVMAAVAAIPGFIDLLSLPRHSRAQGTGLRHAAFNVLSLVLFTISAVILWRNADATVLDVTAPLVLGIVGTLSTVAAGWLGWTLVQTHHVGIQPQRRAASDRDSFEDLDEHERREPKMPDTYQERYRTTLH